MMDWREYIHSDPKIGFGKPIFRGTRIKAEFVLQTDRMAQEYPGIEPQHLCAAAAFAAELMHDEGYFAIGRAKAA